MVKELRAGIVWVNHMQPTFVEAPWGGYKQSGIGRELGDWGVEEYLEVKQVFINLEREADRLVLVVPVFLLSLPRCETYVPQPSLLSRRAMGDVAAPLRVTNPYDNSLVGTTWLAGDAEFETATQAAVDAAAVMRRLPAYERAAILHAGVRADQGPARGDRPDDRGRGRQGDP